jgi:hypothetical protein
MTTKAYGAHLAQRAQHAGGDVVGEGEFESAQAAIAVARITGDRMRGGEVVELGMDVAIVETAAALVRLFGEARACFVVEDARRILVFLPAAVEALVEQDGVGDLRDGVRRMPRVLVAMHVAPVVDRIVEAAKRRGILLDLDGTRHARAGQQRAQPRRSQRHDFSTAGSHSDSCGNRATISSTTSPASQNGQIVRMLSATVILPIEVPMNSTEPIGGVTRPMPPASTITRPKWIGSMP